MEERLSVRDAYARYKQNPELNSEKLLSVLNSYKDFWIEERDKANQRTWRDSLAFYSGNHYVRDDRPSSSYKVKLRENHVNNTLNRMISIFVQNLPITRVFPSSNEYQDIQNAESTELYAKYFWRTHKFEQKIMKWIKYTAIFGNAFTFREYDPDLGGKLVLNGSESGSGETEIHTYRGDIRVAIDDPFKIAVRPGMDELDDMYDLIRSVPGNKFELESKYGKIEAEPAKGLNVYNGSIRQDDDMVMVHHYYHKPTPWFEEGIYACWAGSKLLKVIDYPYEDGKLPIEHLPFDKGPMRFWGMSSIEQVMDLQEQLNRAASMIVEARNLIARPRVFASHEAKVAAQSFTDRPGDIVRFAKDGGRPEFYVPPFNFSELAAHKSDLRQALGSVIGVTNASRGEVPQATRTALALQMVLEQDRSQFLPFIKSFHQGILDLMLGVLSLAAQYFSEEDPRVIKVEGNHSISSRAFHGGMVPSPLDAYLEDTNPLGWTAASRIEQIQVLAEMGVLKDRNQVLEMLKLNSPDPVYELTHINKEAAMKEIELLDKGQFIEPGVSDIDEVHLEQHDKVIASFSFRGKPDVVKEAHLAHRDLHLQRIQAKQPPAPMPGGGDIGPAKEMPVDSLQAPLPKVG